jgi:hypothetical protein
MDNWDGDTPNQSERGCWHERYGVALFNLGACIFDHLIIKSFQGVGLKREAAVRDDR